MNLTETRQALATALAADYPVKDHVPEQISPPVILISTGDPYVEKDEDNTFDKTEFTANIELILVAGSGDNIKKIETLEAMIEDSIVILVNEGWKFSGASAPFEATSNQSIYLASRVAASKEFNL